MWPRRRTAETIDQPSRPAGATAYQPENWGWNAPPYEPSSDAPRRSAARGYATVASILVATINAVRFIVSLAHGGAPLGTTGWGVHVCEAYNFSSKYNLCKSDDSLIMVVDGSEIANAKIGVPDYTGPVLVVTGPGGNNFSGQPMTIRIRVTDGSGRVVAQRKQTDELLIGSRQDSIDDLYLINVLVDTGVPIHAAPYFTSTGAVNSLYTYRVQVSEGKMNLGSATFQLASD